MTIADDVRILGYDALALNLKHKTRPELEAPPSKQSISTESRTTLYVQSVRRPRWFMLNKILSSYTLP